MNMQDMIQKMTDIENSKTQLTESRRIAECPPVAATMPAPMEQGDPVRMNVNISAAGKEHVEDLLSMMKAAGLDNADKMQPDMMPMRQDMERLRSIVDDPEMEADEVYADESEDDLEEYENEPDYHYDDHEKMTHDLSGGINRRKKSYADAEDGDNAMAVEDEDDMRETIKSALMKSLSEKMEAKDTSDKFSKGEKVMVKGKETTVTVPDGPGGLVGVKDIDGDTDMVKASTIKKMKDSDKDS